MSEMTDDAPPAIIPGRPQNSIISSLSSLTLETGFALAGCVAAFIYAGYQALRVFYDKSKNSMQCTSIYLGTALQAINIILAGSMVVGRLSSVTTTLYVVAAMYSLGIISSVLTLMSGMANSKPLVKHIAVIALVFYGNAFIPISLQLTRARDSRGIQSFSHPISAAFTVAVTQTFLQTVNYMS